MSSTTTIVRDRSEPQRPTSLRFEIERMASQRIALRARNEKVVIEGSKPVTAGLRPASSVRMVALRCLLTLTVVVR